MKTSGPSLLLPLAALLAAAGCVSVKIRPTPTITPSNTLVKTLIPAVQSVKLEAELQLPRSRYTAVGKDFSVSLRSGTKARAQLEIPPAALGSNGELIVGKIKGAIEFLPAAQVKIGAFPAVAVARVTADGAVGGTLDVFQTLVSLAFTIGRPAAEDERLPSPATLLRGATLKNVSLVLRPDREIALPAAPGQTPTTIRIGSGAELSLQFLTLDGKLPRATEQRVQTAAGVVAWKVSAPDRDMRFAGNGRARLRLEGIRAVNPDGSEASFASLASDIPFTLTGGDERDTKFAFTRTEGGSHTVALHQLDLRVAGADPARAHLDALDADVNGSEFILDRSSGRMRTWSASLTSLLAGQFSWQQANVAVAGQLEKRPIALAGDPSGFSVDLPLGVAIRDATLAVKSKVDQTEVTLPLIAFGPTSHTQTKTASLSSVGPLDLQFASVTVRGPNGHFAFESVPAGSLRSHAPLVLSPTAAVLPDITFSIPKGRGTIATKDRGAFTFGPLQMDIAAKNLSTSPQAAFHGRVAAEGRVPVASAGLANLRLNVRALDGDYKAGVLDWSLDDARLAVDWADLFAQIKRHGVHAKLDPKHGGARIFPVNVRGLKAGTFTASNLDLRLEGNPSHPELRFDANYKIVYPIDYEVWSVRTGWEMRKIGFIKTKVPVVRAGWEGASGDFVASGSLRLRDMRFDVKAAPLLAQSGINLKGRFGGNVWPSLSGCDWRLVGMVGAIGVIGAPIFVPLLTVVNFTDWTLPFEHAVDFNGLQEPWASTRVKSLGFTQWNSQVIEFQFSGAGRAHLDVPAPAVNLERIGGQQ